MAYTSYTYDLFISYARADDVGGWVEQLYKRLGDLLPRRLDGEVPQIFLDHEDNQANELLDAMLEKARNSALFLAIVSDTYAKRDWTRREIEAFAGAQQGNAGNKTRVFAIECLEPKNRSALPSPLDQLIAKPFWKRLAGTTTTSLDPSDEDYRRNIELLAVEIAEKLRQIHAVKPQGRCVLLAQTTDDLDDSRAKVQSYLAQFGIEVLPADDYPLSGNEFKAAFLEDLNRAGLFVQLLSASPGRKPRDLPEGYTQFQFNAAQQKGIEIMQWHSPELQVNEGTVASKDHRDLLSGKDVIVSTLESFKEQVKRRATEPPKAAAAPPPGLSYVFIDADQDDLEIAEQIRDELCRDAVPAGVPVLKGDPSVVDNSISEHFRDCDVLAVVYGQSTAQWVDRHWVKYSKLRAKRSAPARALIEIWVVPPEEKVAPGMGLDGKRVIKLSPPFNRDSLKPLIEALPR